MGQDVPAARPRLLRGGRAEEETDPRVSAVLEVLGGRSVAEVAARWSVEPVLLHRLVRGFIDAGTAQVTLTPDDDAARQRDRFLTAFAHELRTPLAVAQGWVALLEDGDVPASMLVDTVQRLEDSLARLSERILDVELLGQASLGRVRVSRRTVTIGELAHGLPGLDGVEGEGSEVELHVDPDLFRRVLRDLWEAGRMRPEPRSLRLEVRTIAPWIDVRVVRDADPIDVDVLRALFEPFDTNDDDTGVTIGLYLARALTVVHGGTVGVDQDERGAALWVRIPRSTGPRDRAHPDEEETP